DPKEAWQRGSAGDVRPGGPGRERAPAARDHRRRPDQELRRDQGGPRHRLRGAGGGDVRLPGPQRRRQVDHDQDAVHAGAAHLGAGVGRGPRGNRGTRRGTAQHRLVFQDTTLDNYLTGAQNLRFHAALYGVPASAVEPRMRQVLEMVGLWDRRDSVVMTYSGG